jgi:uncharacterized membrane protein
MLEQFGAIKNLFDLSVHSNHLGGDVAELMESILVFLEQLMSIDSDAILPTIVPGMNAMPNWHPFIVHFPIALLPTFFVLDIIGAIRKNNELRRVASYFLYLGAISSVIAIIAGFKAAETVAHGSAVHSVMEVHELYGLMVTALALVLALWRYHNNTPPRLMANVLHQILSVSLCIFLTLGADLGGLMVYKYGIGVESAKPPVDSHEHMQGV